MKTIIKIALTTTAFIVTGSVFAETRPDVSGTENFNLLNAPQVFDVVVPTIENAKFQVASNVNQMIFVVDSPATLSYSTAQQGQRTVAATTTTNMIVMSTSAKMASR